MSEKDDQRLVDALYDELSASETEAYRSALDASERSEMDALSGVLEHVRAIEDEEPPPHLDALILAKAREQAETFAEENRPWWRKMLTGPRLGLVMATTATVFVAIVTIPVMMDAPESLPATGYDARLEMEEPLVQAPAAPSGIGVDPGAAPREETAVAGELAKEGGRQEEQKAAPLDRTARRPSPRRRAARRAPATTESRTSGGKGDARKAAKLSAPAKKRKARAAAPERDFDATKDGLAMNAEDQGAASGPGRGAGGVASGRASPAGDDALGGVALADEVAELETPAAEPAPPPTKPRPRPKAATKAEVPADAPVAADAEKAQPEPSAGVVDARRVIAEADRRVQKGEVDPARQILVRARTRWVRDPAAHALLSVRLARLELAQNNHAKASAYARDGLRSPDPQVRQRAAVLLRTAESAQR